ncbi:unnamed protein product [Calypogeia fissa]
MDSSTTSSSAPTATPHVRSRYSPSFSGGEAERETKVAGIGRRPLNYRGGEGWASRIGYRTLYGAAAGTGSGLLVGIYKGSNIPKWMGSMGTNCALITLCFCGSQELVRELRASDPDDLENCVLGGLASGGLLGRIQGGPSRALPCALLFAAVGTGVQFGANQLKEYRLRQFLERTSTELRPKAEVKETKPVVEKESWKFPEWFPIQVLDEKAAAKRKTEQEEQFRERVDKLHKGEKP